MTENNKTQTTETTNQELIAKQQQALNLIIQGVHLAQQRGAFNLKEAALLHEATTVFTPLAAAQN